MTNIRQISALETYTVRHPVLRGGKTIESCQFDGDELETTKHFGLFEENILAGVISLFETKHEAFTAPEQTQIRGMAVLEKFQKRGFGALLVQHAEEYARSKQAELIWFNARETAVGFYTKMGYSILGGPFDIANVGTHFIMHKTL